MLKLPGGEAPFGLEIAAENERYVLYLSNGSERTRVNNVKLENNELIAVFPGYENSLRATMHRKRLEGSVTLIKDGGRQQVIPFEATLGATHRFYDEPSTDNADVAGRWKMTLTDDEGEMSNVVALFEQEHDRVTGTVMTATGDHRYPEGQVHGDEVRLSTFAGGLAYLYKLEVNAAGELEGDYWQGMAWHEQVAAQRNDEAMFLAPFYREYRDKGFEIVALMFERHGEFGKAARAVRGHRVDLGIEFPTYLRHKRARP